MTTDRGGLNVAGERLAVSHISRKTSEMPRISRTLLNRIRCAPSLRKGASSFYISGSCESADDTLPYLKQPAAAPAPDF